MSAVADFLGSMEKAGIAPAEPIGSMLAKGELIRFDVKGDRPGRKNGWAVLYVDGRAAGAFGSYRLGISERWRSDRDQAMSPAERAKLQRELAETCRRLQLEREQAAHDAAGRAQAMLAQAGHADPSHPYLVRKAIPGEGIYQRGDVLLVPMHDEGGTVWNVQSIRSDGGKLFLKGGRVTGLMWSCGDPDGTVCIGEGVATMARVRKATGHAVFAAFSEKNLLPVARLVAAQYPGFDHVICADDDAHLVDHPVIKRNLGLDAAHAAAAAIGARVAVPPRSEQ